MTTPLLNQGYKLLAKDTRVARGWFNEVYYDQQKRAVIVLYPSASGADYALNEKVMLDHLKAMRDGFLVAVSVRLVKRTPTGPKMLKEIPLDEIAKRLDGQTPRDGNYGPFFWITAEGRVQETTQELADAPFPEVEVRCSAESIAAIKTETTPH